MKKVFISVLLAGLLAAVVCFCSINSRKYLKFSYIGESDLTTLTTLETKLTELKAAAATTGSKDSTDSTSNNTTEATE